MGKNKKKNNSNSKPVQNVMAVGLSVSHVPSKQKRGRNTDGNNSNKSNGSTSRQLASNETLAVAQSASLGQPGIYYGTGTPIVPVVQAQINTSQTNRCATTFEAFQDSKSSFNDRHEQLKFQIRAENQQEQELMNQLESRPSEHQHKNTNRCFERQQKHHNNHSNQSSYASKTHSRKSAWAVDSPVESKVSYSGATAMKEQGSVTTTGNVWNETPTEAVPNDFIETGQNAEENWDQDDFNAMEQNPEEDWGEQTYAAASDFNVKEQSPEDNWRKQTRGNVSENADRVSSLQDLSLNDDDEAWNNTTPNYADSNKANYEKYKRKDNKSNKVQDNWRTEKSSAAEQNYDEDFVKFERDYTKKSKSKLEFVRVKEIEGDLFAMPKEFSLAHCVAEDMNMGSGIAVQFRREFKQVDELLDQKVRQGGVAFLEVNSRYVYYLVTKRESSGKPTYEKFYLAVKKWRDLVVKHGVQKLAIPRMGCGLDRLEWDKVKYMIETLFRDVDCEIVVCNFQQTSEENPIPPKVKNCKVVNVLYPLSQIESGTILIFLCSEDNHITEEMQDLDKKFHFLLKFRQNKRVLGKPIIIPVQNGNYVLCGCVVKKSSKDDFAFSDFQSCIIAIEKWNRKEKYSYVGFQAIEHTDNQMNQKLINLIRNTFKNVEVYVCWTGNMAQFMPPPRG